MNAEWWRGYRGCQSPEPEEDSEPIVLFRGGDADDKVETDRGLALELAFPGATAEQAIDGVRGYIDLLVDACGPGQLYIRGVYSCPTGSDLPGDACMAIARVIVIPTRVAN